MSLSSLLHLVNPCEPLQNSGNRKHVRDGQWFSESAPLVPILVRIHHFSSSDATQFTIDHFVPTCGKGWGLPKFVFPRLLVSVLLGILTLGSRESKDCERNGMVQQLVWRLSLLALMSFESKCTSRACQALPNRILRRSFNRLTFNG